MPDAIIATLGWVVATGVIALPGLLTGRDRAKWLWLPAALLLMAAYDALLTLGYGHIPLSFWPSDWNWEGKTLSLLLSLAVAMALGWRRVGLTFRQDRKGLPGALVLCGLLAALFVGLALRSPGEGFTADSLAFELTMPGFDEELFYRGVLLLMLNEAFGKPVKILGAPMGWAAIVTSVAFGLAHALGYENGAFTFDAMTMALTGGPALLLVWLKEKTGSLLLPVVMHNFANSISMLI
jgi:membrane protease YdiL (CAAX protease family)